MSRACPHCVDGYVYAEDWCAPRVPCAECAPEAVALREARASGFWRGWIVATGAVMVLHAVIAWCWS